jgi:uncharacterized membrane protein YozB (DUF420 family)
LSDAALAAISAVLNIAATVGLLAGRAAARAGRVDRHRAIMAATILISALFLIAYASRWLLYEPRRFGGEGLARGLYLTILFPHMILAMAVPYIALRAAFLGRAGRIDAHRALVRWGWPVWLFVSITGVVVYAMLYHWPA